MEINRCINCMEETNTYPCPHCNFDPAGQEQPSYAIPPNSILNGRYLVGRMLGQGGFGITYVGWDLALQVKIAIKEFYPSGQVSRHPSTGGSLLWNTGAQTQAFRQTGIDSFLKEARKMARVDRISEVVRVRDIFQENETAYIVMDFVEGETLKDRLLRCGPMSWEEAKTVFLPAISAMSRVHKAGLIHRDISPDNLMLEPDGGVRILDLGAAKDLSVNSGASSMLVAKGGFSPIEQYTQRGGSGTWTDVYAMAATMYYTLTGVLPLPAVDRLDEDTLSWDLPRLKALPGNVLAALRRAMVLSSKNRTQTMDELLSALQEYAKKETAPISGNAAETVDNATCSNCSEIPKSVHAALTPVFRNTGFSSADEMLEAIGLSRKTQAKPVPEGTETQGAVHITPPPAFRHTGFSSADEMLEAIGQPRKAGKDENTPQPAASAPKEISHSENQSPKNSKAMITAQFEKHRKSIIIAAVCAILAVSIGVGWFIRSKQTPVRVEPHYSANGTLIYEDEFDSNGLKKRTFFSDNGTARWTQEFDSYGNCVKTTFYNSDGSIRDIR